VVRWTIEEQESSLTLHLFQVLLSLQLWKNFLVTTPAVFASFPLVRNVPFHVCYFIVPLYFVTFSFCCFTPMLNEHLLEMHTYVIGLGNILNSYKNVYILSVE